MGSCRRVVISTSNHRNASLLIILLLNDGDQILALKGDSGGVAEEGRIGEVSRLGQVIDLMAEALRLGDYSLMIINRARH